MHFHLEYHVLLKQVGIGCLGSGAGRVRTALVKHKKQARVGQLLRVLALAA